MVNNYFNFTGYNILILGGNSGFGFEILKAFSQYKNNIIIVGRNKKKIHKAVNIISKKFKNKKILPINLNLQNIYPTTTKLRNF